jgi:hypothetical protein
MSLDTARRGPKAVEISCDGDTATIQEWATRLGVPQARIRARLAAGWPVERALQSARDYERIHDPVVPLTYQGKTQSMTAWAKEVGLSLSGLSRRLSRGWPVAKALSKKRIVKVTLPTRPCALCQTPTDRTKYCTKKCMKVARARKLYPCLTCGVDSFNPRYCSRKCAAGNRQPRLISFQKTTRTLRQWALLFNVEQGAFNHKVNVHGLVFAFEWALKKKIRAKPKWVPLPTWAQT